MNVREVLKLSTLILYRSKKNKFYISIVIICTIIAIGILCLTSNISNYVNKEFENYIGYRTLNVSPNYDKKDFGKSELLSVKYVKEVYKTKYRSYYIEETSLKNDNLDGTMYLLYGSPKIIPAIIEGRNIKDGEENVAICPKDFYPDRAAIDYSIKKEYLINGSDLLEKSFIVKYYSYKWDDDGIPKDKQYEMEFKIVGLYDSKDVMNFSNYCYVSPHNLIEIVDTSSGSEENNPNYAVTSNESFLLVVDKLSNVDSVSQTLQGMGYGSMVSANIDVNLIETIQAASIFTLMIVMGATVLFTIFYTKKKLMEDKKTIGILRISGYENKLIRKIYATMFLLTNAFSYVIGLLMFLTIFIILKGTLLQSLTYSGIQITLNISSILLAVLIVIVMPIYISIRNVNKSTKTQIVDLLGEK